jgi:hypothetical protein
MTPSCAQECLRWADETDNEEYRRWVWGGGRMSEVIGRFHQNGGRVRDQATVPLAYLPATLPKWRKAESSDH